MEGEGEREGGEGGREGGRGGREGREGGDEGRGGREGREGRDMRGDLCQNSVLNLQGIRTLKNRLVSKLGVPFRN